MTPPDPTTVIGVARILGRSIASVAAYENDPVRQIEEDLALGPRSASLIANLGTSTMWGDPDRWDDLITW